MRRAFVLAVALAAPALAQLKSINPAVSSIVGELSEQRISATLKKLESFGTRNILSSQTDPQHGIGAARDWIAAELRTYSPRLEVSFDKHRIKKKRRVTRDVEISNIVAVLPGTINREQQVLITAHYDTLALGRPLTEEQRRAGEELNLSDPDATAPGVNDDGSGTAAVMELARVMSRYQFEKTLVFVLFAAEEQGLLGSTLFAMQARAEKRPIEAVLNNDIIGSEVAGDGRADTNSVRVFSEDPNDSPSRQLARYIKEIGERYVPSMRVDLIFRGDRFSRGGDHTPFNQENFTAVRLSSAEENYANQHTASDTFANMSVPYTTRVTRINGAVAATLAWAPKTPVTQEPLKAGPRKGQPPAMIGRGKSGYAAQLRWSTPAPEADLLGFLILMRSTTDALWQKSIFLRKDVSEFSMEDVSIDEYVFGIQAVDTDGNPSLASTYVFIPREKATIETY